MELEPTTAFTSALSLNVVRRTAKAPTSRLTYAAIRVKNRSRARGLDADGVSHVPMNWRAIAVPTLGSSHTRVDSVTRSSPVRITSPNTSKFTGNAASGTRPQ